MAAIGHSVYLLPVDKQAKQGVLVMRGVAHPEHHE